MVPAYAHPWMACRTPVLCAAFLLHGRFRQHGSVPLADTDVAELVAALVDGEDTCADPPARWPSSGVRVGLGACGAVFRFISGDVAESSRLGNESAFAVVAQLPQQRARQQVTTPATVASVPNSDVDAGPGSIRVAIELLEASNGWLRFAIEQVPEPDPEPKLTDSHKTEVGTTANLARAVHAPLFAVDRCVVMWSVHALPAWCGSAQAMTMTGAYQDNPREIAKLFDELVMHVGNTTSQCPAMPDTTATSKHCQIVSRARSPGDGGSQHGGEVSFRPPLLAPGLYSTSAPWATTSDDLDDRAFERPRRPDENTCKAWGQSFGIEVAVDGTVIVCGPEGPIKLERLLERLVQPLQRQPVETEDARGSGR